jgi:hypothetical protein
VNARQLLVATAALFALAAPTAQAGYVASYQDAPQRMTVPTLAYSDAAVRMAVAAPVRALQSSPTAAVASYQDAPLRVTGSTLAYSDAAVRMAVAAPVRVLQSSPKSAVASYQDAAVRMALSTAGRDLQSTQKKTAKTKSTGSVSSLRTHPR